MGQLPKFNTENVDPKVLYFATNLLICPKWSCSNKLSIAISLWNVKTIHQCKDQGNKKNQVEITTLEDSTNFSIRNPQDFCFFAKKPQNSPKSFVGKKQIC